MKNQKLFYSCMILGLLLYAWFAREWAYHIGSLFGKTILQLTRHLIHIGLILVPLFGVFLVQR